MRGQRSPTIRGRLVVLVFAVAAPAAAITAGLLGYRHHEDRKRLEDDSIATARALVQAIDKELVTLVAAAQVLATSNRAQAGDIASFYPQAAQVAALRIGRNVVLSDLQGRQVLNTLRAPGEPLPLHGNPSQLRRVLETKLPAISDLYIGGVLRQPVISVDVPVMREGALVYVLSIGELPDRFRALLSAQRLPPGWIGAVFDSTGTVVARTHEHDRFVGKKGSAELVSQMADRREGALEATTLEGIPVISVFSRSADTGWSVALGIPRDSLLQQLRRQTLLASVAALASLAIGLLLAQVVASGIARSIHGLLEPAARIGRRERVEVPALGLREADEVGRAIMHASDLILSAEHRAGHDALTELPNRALFVELAAHAIEASKRSGCPAAVLFVDLDGFKQVNDTYGHGTGDALLAEVGLRIKRAVRAADIASRLGGDEFAVLLVNADATVAARVAGKLLQTLSAAYELDAGRIAISASIGVAVHPEAGEDVEALVRNADEAMYKAKSAGKASVAVAARPSGG